MTHIGLHLGELWEMLTGSPWPGRVLIILAIFLSVILGNLMNRKKK
jgi:hypothetical protein